MPIIAEVNPDAAAALLLLQGFFWLCAGIGAICGAIYGVKKLLKGDKPAETVISGQPVQVVKAAHFATKEEHTQLAGRVDKLDEKLDTKFSELSKQRSASIAGLHQRLEADTESLRKEIKEDIKGVHDRINQVLAAVCRLEGPPR